MNTQGLKPAVVHVITPLSRPKNLKLILRSIEAASPPKTELLWHVVADGNRMTETETLEASESIPSPMMRIYWCSTPGKAGHPQRNFILNRLRSGVVCFIDDDTTMHPGFLNRCMAEMAGKPARGVIVSQTDKWNKPRCEASPANMRPTAVDTGQGLIPVELIGDIRFEEYNYAADGVFYQEVYRRHPSKFIFVKEPLSVYNAIA